MNGLSLRLSGKEVSSFKKNENNIPVFQITYVSAQRFGHLENIGVFQSASSVNKQLDYVKSMSKCLDLTNEDSKTIFVIEFIVLIFLQAPPKHPLKNTCLRILLSKKHLYTTIENVISNEISGCIAVCDYDDQDAANELCTSINSCFENFTPGIRGVQKCLKNVFHFVKTTLTNYVTIVKDTNVQMSPTEKMALYVRIHNANRLLFSIVQKCYVDILSTDDINDWKEYSSFSLTFINHADLPMDTKSLCSMILISLLKLRFGTDTWIFLLQIIYKIDDHRDHLLYDEISYITSGIEVLCIVSALTNIIPVEDMCSNHIENIPIINFLCKKLLCLSEESSVDTTMILGVARTILSISRLLFKVSNSDIILNAASDVLTFTWSHLEYYVDSVRHLSTQTLTNVVKLSVDLRAKGNNCLCDEIFSSVMVLPNDRQSKYKGIATLASEYGSGYLLNKFPNIVEDILSAANNITIPANVSFAFETLMLMHLKEVSTDVVFTTWIVPILKDLIARENIADNLQSNISFYEDILAKAVKLNSNLISLMIPCIMQQGSSNSESISDGQLKCILVCLHVARKMGIFDTKDIPTSAEQKKWKDIIEYELLEHAMTHLFPEITILALSLIVDSHKSTEYFVQEEFKVMDVFFRYNINVQSPAVRQRILALTKKMLKRWKESFDVIIRNIETSLKAKSILKDNEKSEEMLKDKCVKINRKIEATIALKNAYLYFITELWKFCMNNIIPSANFSRRNISLQILVWCQEIDLRNLSWIWKYENGYALLNYLDDSYECNKQLVVQLLVHCPVDILQFNSVSYLREFLNSAILAASNVKPTDCITSAYKLELLINFPTQLWPVVLCDVNFTGCRESIPYGVHYCMIKQLTNKLLKEMNIAKENILFAAANGPLYGLLHCIRHILGLIDFKNITTNKDWTLLITDLIKISFEVNKIIAPIVNSSSPEGHLPMDFNAGSNHVEGNGVQLDCGRIVTAQMVLLCSWRSVKEVSLLLGDISFKAVIQQENPKDTIDFSSYSKGTIREQTLLDIGDHFTTLLSETKHRGAFEQAYLGFSKLCSRLWKCQIQSLHTLPRIWLDDLITAISSGDTKNSKLCATRRSAGVPFMVQALVTTELQVSGNPHSFQRCISMLLRLATFDKSTGNNGITVETRTHCLNILRALYRHTALGEYVNPYVADGLITAISGFDGATWAERNSSTLLFSSLMTRIFGVQRTKDSEQLCIRNKMTGRIFFLRYPKLYDFILIHLKDVSKNIDSKDFLKPSLYPILLLLARLYPSSLEGIDSNLQLVAYVPYLLLCAKSCILKTRQLAAKAMVPLISHDRYLEHTVTMLNILSERSIKTNHCHGILLQLIKLLQHIPETLQLNEDNVHKIMTLLDKSKWIIFNLAGERPCYVTAEAYLKVIYLLIDRFTDIVKKKPEFFEEILTFISKMSSRTVSYTHMIHFGKEHFYIQYLHFNLSVAYMRNASHISLILIEGLNSSMYEIQLTILNYLLCIYNINDLKNICEQFEINSTEKYFASKLSLDEIQIILNTLESSGNYKQSLMTCIKPTAYLHCRKKALMILSLLPQCFDEIVQYFKPTASTFDDKTLALIELADADLENVNYIFLRFINAYLKSNKSATIYKCCSDETVLAISEMLLECSHPDRIIYKRVESANILVDHWEFFDWKESQANSIRIQGILLQWSSVLRLMDDDEDVIRKGISKLATLIGAKEKNQYLFNENKAKEVVLDIFSTWTRRVSIEYSIMLLIILALGDNLYVSQEDIDEYQVFDKGDTNAFQEEFSFINLCTYQMKQNLIEIWETLNSEQRKEYILNNVIGKHNELWNKHFNNENIILFKRLLNMNEKFILPLEWIKDVAQNNITEYKIKCIINELDIQCT